MSTDNPKPTAFELIVRGTELEKAALLFARFFKKKKAIGDALLTFREGQLRIELGGLEQNLMATGTWPGEARLPGRAILAFASLPQARDVALAATEESLVLRGLRGPGSSLTLPCIWETSPRQAELLPLNAGLRENVAFGFAHTATETDRLGLTEVVDRAMEKAQEMIKLAADHLKPLGVSEENVRELVKRTVLTPTQSILSADDDAKAAPDCNL